MAKSRHRDNGGKRFHARRAGPPPPQEPEPWGLTEQNARSIAQISAAGGIHPNQALNELVAMAIASSRVLHAQLAFGGALSARPAPAAAPGPTPAPDPSDVDDRSAEERLAARRDVASRPVTETIKAETGEQGEAVKVGVSDDADDAEATTRH